MLTMLTQNPPFLSGNWDDRSAFSRSQLWQQAELKAPFSKMPWTREQHVRAQIHQA